MANKIMSTPGAHKRVRHKMRMSPFSMTPLHVLHRALLVGANPIEYLLGRVLNPVAPCIDRSRSATWSRKLLSVIWFS